MSIDHDLRIRVPDATRFPMLSHVRVTIDLCGGPGPGKLPTLELRGYELLP